MKIKKDKVIAEGTRFSVEVKGKEVARAFLYILRNDLHDNPFGLLEDLFVDEHLRGQGAGTALVKTVIEEARANGCYKLIAGSRYARERVHRLYEKLGFQKHGIEFRLNLSN